MTFARLKFEDLGGLLDVLLPLRFEDRHALVPHLQCQLLHQVLEVFQDHGLHDLQVQVCIDVVLALNHEKLDLDPHVDRIKVAHDMLVFLQVLTYFIGIECYGLTVIGPELFDLRLASHVEAVRAYCFGYILLSRGGQGAKTKHGPRP